MKPNLGLWSTVQMVLSLIAFVTALERGYPWWASASVLCTYLVSLGFMDKWYGDRPGKAGGGCAGG